MAWKGEFPAIPNREGSYSDRRLILLGFVRFGGLGGFRPVGRRFLAVGWLLHEFKGTGTAQDAGTFVARAGAF